MGSAIYQKVHGGAREGDLRRARRYEEEEEDVFKEGRCG